MAGAVKSLVSAKGLNFECPRILHESILLLVLMYSSETVVWNEKCRSKVHVVQMGKGVSVRKIDEMNKEGIKYKYENKYFKIKYKKSLFFNNYKLFKFYLRSLNYHSFTHLKISLQISQRL